MPSKEFTFFSVMLVFDLVFSRLPILDQLPLFVLPLIIIVSGWRYGIYYVVISELFALPYLIQKLPAIYYLLDILNMMLHTGPEKTGEFIKSNIGNSVVPVLPAWLILSPALSLGMGVGLFLLSAIMVYGMGKGFVRWWRMIKTLQKITKSWHR